MKTITRLPVIPTLFAGLLLCLPAQSQTFSVLYNFTGGADGNTPNSPLTRDSSGNLYGFTIWGGANNLGVLFKLDSLNHESVLYNFGANANDGAYPEGNLLRDKAGNFYGTTRGGGSSGLGTAFAINASNQETILHNFMGGADGAKPFGLTADLTGSGFGTTTAGGDPNADCGVVYTIDRSGQQTILYAFFCQLDGGVPSGPVTVDPSGNLYGCNAAGGSDAGVLYKLDPSGILTVLHDFGHDGSLCAGNIVRDTAGNLYGNTSTINDGEGDGVTFKLDPSGTYSVLHTFTGSKEDGASPASGLILDDKGFLYGTTQYGGTFNQGTVFRIKASTGAFVLIHSFSGSDGANPALRLSRDSEGNIYGTTEAGGSSGRGVIFKITP